MTGQPMLDFGGTLAPKILVVGENGSKLPRAPVHSANEAIPGEGRRIVTCKRCGQTRRRKRESLFCTDACKDAHRHDEQGKTEERKKQRAMRGSASLNAGYLRITREAARRIRLRDGTADADRVRLLLDSEGTELPGGGWWGSLFPSDPDYRWTVAGHVNSKRKGSRCSEIKVWG